MLGLNNMQSTFNLSQIYQAIDNHNKALVPKLYMLVLMLIIVCVLGLNIGAVQLNVIRWVLGEEQSALQQTVLWEIRAPRVLMTIIT